jgi:hypothetical protein
MPNGMTWRVEEVEAAVPVEVVGVVLPDFEGSGHVFEVDLNELTTFPGSFIDGGIVDGGIARSERFFESGTDDEVCGLWKSRGISCMILRGVCQIGVIQQVSRLTKCQ